MTTHLTTSTSGTTTRAGRSDRRDGFTLIELVVVLSVFGLVMAMCYEILSTTIDAEKTVNELTREGTIGQSVMTSIRRDLQSAAHFNLGAKVFIGTDRGENDGAEDEIHFLTFAPVPEPPDSGYDDWARDVTSVGYVLKDGGEEGNTLFRRVNWNILDAAHLEDGKYYQIYDRVKALAFRFFDGTEWVDEWDSEEQVEKIRQYWSNQAGIDEEASTSGDFGSDREAVPTLLPRAVEVELFVFLGDEAGLLRNANDEPVVERHYMVVPLMTMQSLDLDPNATDEEEDEEI